jgi:hypothetical protein
LGSGSRCDVATASKSGDRAISLSWPSGAQAPGGQCVIPFVVADAQERTGSGSLTLDLQGFPQAPASVTTVGYTKSTVVLEVPLGAAAGAHPAVTSVTILQDGAPANASCVAAGAVYQCTVSGLVTGAPHTFTAVAVNAVGSSAPTSPHTSWAYAPPEVSSAAATPVYRAGVTDASRGVAEVTISASPDAASFRIQETGQVINRNGTTTKADVVLAPGAQTITVVPISQFQPPSGDIGNEGGAVSTSVQVAGAPYFSPSGTQAVAASNTSVNVSGIAAQTNGSSQPMNIVYVAWRSGNASCTAGVNGELQVSGAEQTSASPSIQNLAQYKRYSIKACVSNGFGVAESQTTSVFTFTFVDGPGGNTTYTVKTDAVKDGNRYSYPLQSAPALTLEEGFAAQYLMYGSWRGDFSLSLDSSPGQVKARACHPEQPGSCSGEVNITATTAPTIVDVTFDACMPPAMRESVVTVSAAARGSYSFSTEPVADEPGVFDVKITWRNAFATLSNITHRVSLCE